MGERTMMGEGSGVVAGEEADQGRAFGSRRYVPGHCPFQMTRTVGAFACFDAIHDVPAHVS
jgi:hypothetical protein